MERTRRPCVWRAALLSMKSCKRSLYNYEDVFLQGYLYTGEFVVFADMPLSWRSALGLANVCICNKSLETLQKDGELLSRWSIVCIINYGFRQSSYRRCWRLPRFLRIFFVAFGSIWVVFFPVFTLTRVSLKCTYLLFWEVYFQKRRCTTPLNYLHFVTNMRECKWDIECVCE